MSISAKDMKKKHPQVIIITVSISKLLNGVNYYSFCKKNNSVI